MEAQIMTNIKNTEKEDSHSIEERLNSMTHAIGAGMSIAGMIFLLVLANINGASPLAIASFALYGAFQILLYLSSSSMHLFTDKPAFHKKMHILDQSAIYLLIAGTYTPVALLALGGTWGWVIFGLIWGMAAAGIIMKSFIFTGRHIASDLLYLPMGWLIIIAIKPLIAAMPNGFFLWMGLGAASYCIGILFYIFNKFPLSHVIWHLFVIAGGVSFFIGFAKYLV
jgi:hemolysin III